MEYYSAQNQNEIMPFAATWMDLEIIILSEVSQKGKDKCYVVSLKCGIYTMTQMNLSMKQRLTHTYHQKPCKSGDNGITFLKSTERKISRNLYVQIDSLQKNQENAIKNFGTVSLHHLLLPNILPSLF